MAPLKLKKKDGMSLKSLSPLLCFCMCHLSWNIVDAQRDSWKRIPWTKSVTVLKNSAAWLHWKNIFADAPPGLFIFYRQEFSVKVNFQKKFTVIAERIGLNGTMTVSRSLPKFLNGRVAAFPKNNSLIINNLHYNDSLYTFASFIIQKAGGSSSGPFKSTLKSKIILNVVGAPKYISTPASSFETSENGNFSVMLRFDGNPKPTAELQWSHSNAKDAMTVTKEYKFIYKATHSFDSVTSKHCGRTFNVTVKNKIGKAIYVSSTVTVLLNFVDPNLRAAKQNKTCVEVRWDKKDSGACNVTYFVKFKNVVGIVIYESTEFNTGMALKCGIHSGVNITDVELTMISTKRNKTFSASVSELPPTAATVTSSVSTCAIVGGVFGVVALVQIVLLVLFFVRKRRRGALIFGQGTDKDSGEPGLPLTDKEDNIYASSSPGITPIVTAHQQSDSNADPNNVTSETHYMELQCRAKTQESVYESLTSSAFDASNATLYANVTELRTNSKRI